MVVTLDLVLLICACVCFVLAALGASVPRVNLTAAGLALWTFSLIV